MRYRALDANGDMTFGQGVANFMINTPAAVQQAILTKLKLLAGEWFLDVNEGTPYSTQILGPTRSAGSARDRVIRERIQSTPGVLKITAYSSQLNPATRRLTVSATVTTIYGQTTISTVFPLGSGTSGRTITTPDGTIITGPGGEIITA